MPLCIMHSLLLIVSMVLALADAAPTMVSTTITTETVTASLTTAGPPMATLSQQYSHILTTISKTATEVNTVMFNFRNERISGNDVDQMWVISGVPSIHSFPLGRREAAVAQDLLVTYRDNLNIFDTALTFVISDEDNYRGHNGYRSRFTSLRGNIRDIVAQLESIISCSNLPAGVNQAPVSTQVWFRPSADETERAKRDFVTLRQLSEYLPAAHASLSRIRP